MELEYQLVSDREMNFEDYPQNRLQQQDAKCNLHYVFMHDVFLHVLSYAFYFDDKIYHRSSVTVCLVCLIGPSF